MIQAYLQKGWTTFGVIGVIASAAIGAFCFEILFRLIPVDATVVAPWAIVSLFLLPLSFCVQLILKLWDLKEQTNISREERRRLKLIIDEKTRRFFGAVFYYVLSAFIIVTLFFFLSNNAELFRIVIKITGGLLSISLFSIYLIMLEMKEIADFKAKLIERADSKKRQKLALKRLKAEE
ncbi:MAG: hypothetical protein M0Q44_01170 [Methylobacter sp.]|jgi:uncharacterized membrane protein (TIGR01218 family)|nr:hypothetical protein [Methylobacter sp.]